MKKAAGGQEKAIKNTRRVHWERSVKNVALLDRLARFVGIDWRGDTRGEFVRAVGINPKSVSKINILEAGNHGFSLAVLERISEKLGIPFEALRYAYKNLHVELVDAITGLKDTRKALPGTPAGAIMRSGIIRKGPPRAIESGQEARPSKVESIAAAIFNDCVDLLRKMLNLEDRRGLVAIRGVLEAVAGAARGPTELREFQRFPAPFAIRVRLVNDGDRGKYIRGKLVNISGCGAQIMTEVGISPGSKIVGYAWRDPKAKEIVGQEKQAEVIWSRWRRDGRDGEFQYFHGVCFEKPDPGIAQRVMDLSSGARR